MVESVAVCTTFWACVHEFQTLIAGTLAVAAAVATGYVIWRSANLPITEQARRDQETAANRQRHECLVLSSQLRALRRRGSQAASTIRVHIAANADVSDATKEKMYLEVPTVIANWEVMSMLPPGVVQQCLDLTQKLEDHNFDIARAGGAFGDDNFRRSLRIRLGDIRVSVGKLANDLTAVAQKLASNPQVRKTAAKAARVVVDEVEQIARREDKALNAGRAVRRAINKLQGRST
jgi:hypothetical protein